MAVSEDESNEYHISALSDLQEITSIYDADLYLRARTLQCGDHDNNDTLAALIEELTQTYPICGLTADGNDAAGLALDEIDYSDLDINTPGTYTIVVRLKLDDTDPYSAGFTISDETRTLYLSVTVYDPDKLTLTYSKTTQSFVEYLISPPGNDNLTLWYAVTEPDTEPSEDEWTSDIPEGFCTYTEGNIRIYQTLLDTNKCYFLKVCRDGLTSNVIKLVPLTDNNSTGDGMGGDRDGSDTDDGTLDKPLVQTPPSDSGSSSSDSKSSSAGVQMSQSAASVRETESEPPAVYEHIDRNTLTISGSRLRMMLSPNADIIPFGWNGISLEMPASFIETLALSDTDMLSLTLTHEDKLAFSVFLTVSGTEIKELPSSLIRIPAQMPEGKYSLLRSGETIPVEVSYENNCAVFSIIQTGRYLLKDVPVTAEDIKVPDLSEKASSKERGNAGNSTTADKSSGALNTAGTSAPAGNDSVIAPSAMEGASASDICETTSSSDLSAEENHTLPAPGVPDVLPAAAGTVSLSAAIYRLWRKHR